jgi:DNA-binding CsgD family transcriptional regulator
LTPKWGTRATVQVYDVVEHTGARPKNPSRATMESVSGDHPLSPLLGRQRETKVLAELLDSARQGRSGVLVIRGEPGIGKTALLVDTLAQASGFRTVQISGAESEMELAYAGVQQLCGPLSGFIDRLPERQQKALHVALGLSDGATPDRLLVGLAVLTLLAEASADRPTLCIVDDAQWVDSASMQALAFVARRILADPLAMIFAARPDTSNPDLAGQPELELGGLDDRDARALLDVMIPGRLDEQVRDNILREAGGNPLALRELHKALKPGELAGGYGLATAKSLAARIERIYGQRLRELPPQTSTLLLIAAAEPGGRPAWLWAAAQRLGIGADAAAPAELAGLIVVDVGIRFEHPLIRAAIYRSASSSQRRRVHGALAEAIEGLTGAEHRAWHRAHAAEGPDEKVAQELERSAERARARGGIAAAAAFLEYAAKLSPDPARQTQRALDAAQAKLDAGSPEAAAALLATATERADDEFIRGRIELLKAKLAFAASRGSDAPPLLLAAAERLQQFDPGLSRETYLEAMMASILVGRLSNAQCSVRDVAAAARGAPPAASPARAVDLLVDGLALRLTDGHGAAAALLTSAIREFLHEDEDGKADPRWHDLTHRVCLDVFDQDNYNFLVGRQVDALRASGELTVLPVALITYGGLCVTSGDFDRAATLLEEAQVIITATLGVEVQTSMDCYLAAYRGQEQLCRELMRTTIADSTMMGRGFEVATTLYAAAILHNGLGQYSEALTAATEGAAYDDVGVCGYLLVEQVEAATRAREPAVAADARSRLLERTNASSTDTAFGLAARSTALVSDGQEAETAFREAIERLERSPVVLYLARTHLVYGEWLRREKRRADARIHLQTAYDSFVTVGADAFAQRARRELQATGETVRARSVQTPIALTTQESHIARLARQGHTNSEIAAQLFLSPRTVEWHLGRVFGKLGVSSRRELRNAQLDLP